MAKTEKEKFLENRIKFLERENKTLKKVNEELRTIIDTNAGTKRMAG